MENSKIFKREEKIVADAEALLASDALPDGEGRESFDALLKAYRKLLRTTSKLVKISDRNEAELNRVANTLDEKSTMLEGLSQNLSKYLSPQIYDQIFTGAQGVELKTARKKLTVFFSDLKDFTQTTEDLQPEDLTYLLNKYFSEMSKIALKHGATIDKFIGDAMVMFFGDPNSKGVLEDAKSCVRMAIEMQRRMEDLREIWNAKGYEHPFQMRIGINTGFCNVGNFGSDARMDYTIIGNEVNLAARLEGKAEPGGILMSYETYALVRDIVHAEPREPIQVKGIRRDVVPYDVRGILEGMDSSRRFLRHVEEG
ncbi:MAG: adenylate/guanylate cyclase domain-containing protein, partial [Rhodospirillaceae bacterium]